MKIRCSQLGKIMTTSRSKSEPLSKTAQSYIKQLVKEDLFGYKSFITTKEMEKGVDEENTSIALFNQVKGTNYEKNIIRLENDWITGECDLKGFDEIVDIKSSWSLETFPASPSDINSNDYEWQLRGYMWLYDKPKATLAYCMVDTPDYLLKDWDYQKIHKVSNIDASLRVTTVSFERDIELEEQIKEKVELCKEFYFHYKNEILNK